MPRRSVRSRQHGVRNRKDLGRKRTHSPVRFQERGTHPTHRVRGPIRHSPPGHSRDQRRATRRYGSASAIADARLQRAQRRDDRAQRRDDISKFITDYGEIICIRNRLEDIQFIHDNLLPNGTTGRQIVSLKHSVDSVKTEMDTNLQNIPIGYSQSSSIVDSNGHRIVIEEKKEEFTKKIELFLNQIIEGDTTQSSSTEESDGSAESSR